LTKYLKAGIWYASTFEQRLLCGSATLQLLWDTCGLILQLFTQVQLL